MGPRRGCTGRRQPGQFADGGAGRTAPPAPEPSLRPTIDDWNTSRAAPAVGVSAASGATSRSRKSSFQGGPGERRQGRDCPPDGAPAHTPAGAQGGTTALLSSRAASAANSAFSRLNDATAPRSPRAERPLDEMTRDCLRPLLKAWLDENLPGMVERLVREEIARVARRGS
jgi:cell pole-organizing protein PopZ